MPLTGKCILVTQAKDKAENQIKRLKNKGADVIHKPTIAIQPPHDYYELDKNLSHINKFQWILFTSPNAVKVFKNRLAAIEIDKKDIDNIQIAVIGDSTAKIVQLLGFRVNFVPKKQSSYGFLREFTARYPDLTGIKILFPASDIARNIVTDGLVGAGAEVIRIIAYKTVSLKYPPEEIMKLFQSKKVDLVTFTSSSTVDNLMALLPEKKRQTIIPKIHAASIGPMTSKTLRSYGIEPVIEAQVHTIPGLVDAIVKYYQN